MFRIQRSVFPLLLFIMLLAGSASAAKADNIVLTLPDFNGSFTAGGTFPRPPVTVGTFNFTLPPGFQIGSVTLSGTFGNAINGTSAPTSLLLDSLQMGQCSPGGPCTGAFGTVGPTAFSFDLTSANFSVLLDGSAVFTISQLGPGVVRLGNLSLTIRSIPEPATLILLGSGLAAVAGACRKRMRRSGDSRER